MLDKRFDSSRRRFLARTVPAGALVCLGCKGLFALPGQESRFSENPGMTTEEMYRFFYGVFIPTMQSLAKRIGREKLVKELTGASAENTVQMIAAMSKGFPNRDMKAFAGLIDRMMRMPPANKAFTYEVTESSDKVLEWKFTQCLPAKMWLEMKAPDLGYALECSAGDAMVKAFNPRMKAVESKNLMRGDGYCLARFELV